MTSIQTLNGGLSRTADAVDKEVGSKNHNSAQSNRSEYERLTVDQLRKLLKRRSLKQQGNKSDLVNLGTTCGSLIFVVSSLVVYFSAANK